MGIGRNDFSGLANFSELRDHLDCGGEGNWATYIRPGGDVKHGSHWVGEMG